MSKHSFFKVFKRTENVVISMLHLPALPGSPKNTMSMSEIREFVLAEAHIYAENGVDAMMIENMHDVPYVKSPHIGPEVMSAMASVATTVKSHFSNFPIGVQVLTAGNKEAMSIAKCADLDFIRAEGFVFSHIGDEGIIDSDAASLLRYRRSINAENVLVFADIKKKHSSHSITADVSLGATARAAEFFLADGVVVTGEETGAETDPNDVHDVMDTVKNLPVLVGSGINVKNISEYLGANAFILGSHFKFGSDWSQPVQSQSVANFMKKLNDLR